MSNRSQINRMSKSTQAFSYSWLDTRYVLSSIRGFFQKKKQKNTHTHINVHGVNRGHPFVHRSPVVRTWFF